MSIFGKRAIAIIGGFPLCCYGSVLQEEEEWFEAKDREKFDRAISILKLAQKIAKDKELSEEKALELVYSAASEENGALLMAYTGELSIVFDAIAAEKRFPVEIATLTIKSRCDLGFLEEHAADLLESFDIAFKGEWRIEDTRKLPVKLINELALFMIRERNGNPPEPEETKSLGESSANSNQPDPPLEQTGKRSTRKSRQVA